LKSSFLEIAPTGTVPALHDPERNLTLWESNAILCYLAEKYDLVDLYPTDIGQRALVNQWLHWHHGNSRQFTYALFAPVVRKDLKISQEQVDRDTKRLTGIARTMDNHLKVHRYLTGDDVSLADIACYEDVGQCNEQNIQLFDFSPYPSVVDWMHRMEQLPGFKESHGVVLKLKKFFKKSNI